MTGNGAVPGCLNTLLFYGEPWQLMRPTNLSARIRRPSKASALRTLLRRFSRRSASLRLTVCLLVLAVVVTFIATVDQTRNDILDVKHKHFQNVFVEVPFQTLFVQRWFPEYQNVPGSFYVPSGVTLLVLMLLNLTAAHMLRFRLQATGARRITGIIAALLAAVLTWTIIFNGQDASGFQNEPPISFDKMWILLQLAVLAVACAAGFGFFTIDRNRRVERTLLAISAVVCGGLLVVSLLLGEQAFIGDSAMRILWQLAQSTIAAVVSLVACMLLFKRKAGIVLLHLGIAGLMFNEIYVTTTNEESRMTIVEGESVSQAIDIRSTELAIIDTSDQEIDEITVVPDAKLKSGEWITDPALPFDVKCIRFLSNSDIRELRDPGNNVATAGIGKRLEAFDLPITTGTDSEQTVDFASAYVELKEQGTGKPLGTYLVSQNLDVKNADEVVVDGKSYRIDLRFKTDYKPFELTLVDVQAEYYLATETPRWFSSDVILNDVENGTTSDQKIWMNNPLRYSGNTFYQQSLGTLPSGQEYTILQVVKNKGWMIPYVCCMFTVVGLVFQFGSSLLSYLEKNQTRTADGAAEKAAAAIRSANLNSGKPVKPIKPNPQPSPDPTSQGQWLLWLPTAVLVGFLGFYVVGELVKTQVAVIEKNGMRLDLLGQIPITKDGRVQPLDSFARNTARQLSKREEIFDGNDERQPAIRWLADTIFEADGYLDYRAFRIEDPTILSALDLPLTMPTAARDKNRFRYTLQELLDAEPTLMELLPNREETDPKTWSVFQKRLSQVATQMQRVYGAKLTFGGPEPDDDDNLILRLEQAGKAVSSPLIPLVVPTEDPEKPWKSFIVLQNQVWLSDLAEKFDAPTTDQLATKIIDDEIIPPLREELIRSRIIERMTSDPNILKMLSEGDSEADPQALASMLERRWDEFPPAVLEQFMAAERPFVDMMLTNQRPRYEKVMADQLAKINDGAGQIVDPDSDVAKLLLELRPAYLDGDAEKFNSTLVSYLETVRNDPPQGMSKLKLNLEKTYNGFAPFYLAMVIYLIAFLVGTLAWVGWAPAWNRAAELAVGVGRLHSNRWPDHAGDHFRASTGHQPVLFRPVCIGRIRDRFSDRRANHQTGHRERDGRRRWIPRLNVGLDNVDRRWGHFLGPGCRVGHSVLAVHPRGLHLDRLQSDFHGRLHGVGLYRRGAGNTGDDEEIPARVCKCHLRCRLLWSVDQLLWNGAGRALGRRLLGPVLGLGPERKWRANDCPLECGRAARTLGRHGAGTRAGRAGDCRQPDHALVLERGQRNGGRTARLRRNRGRDNETDFDARRGPPRDPGISADSDQILDELCQTELNAGITAVHFDSRQQVLSGPWLRKNPAKHQQCPWCFRADSIRPR